MTTTSQQLNETVFVDNSNSNDTASLSSTHEDRMTVPVQQILHAADPVISRSIGNAYLSELIDVPDPLRRR